jgi:hypothetical protein
MTKKDLDLLSSILSEDELRFAKDLANYFTEEHIKCVLDPKLRNISYLLKNSTKLTGEDKKTFDTIWDKQFISFLYPLLIDSCYGTAIIRISQFFSKFGFDIGYELLKTLEKDLSFITYDVLEKEDYASTFKKRGIIIAEILNTISDFVDISEHLITSKFMIFLSLV